MRQFILVLTFMLTFAMSSAEVSAAGKGMVKIVTMPGDAKIFINGKRKGNSPSEPGQTFAIKLPEGEYVVEAVKLVGKRKENYAKKQIFVSEDTLQTITLRLSTRLTEVGKRLEHQDKAAKAMRIQVVVAKIKRNMVEIPGGTFRMGCLRRKGCFLSERPAHRVTLSSFYVGKYEVTFEEWDACFDDGGCQHRPRDEGWGRGNRPVVNVSWNDIQKFTKWLNKKTGSTWRLPTEAEWEYAARAGSKTKYFWGNSIGKNNANCAVCGSQWSRKQTAPAGKFRPNKFGLHDMHGNVTEWVYDWYGDRYYKNSSLRNPRGPSSGPHRVTRGGNWHSEAGDLRPAKHDCLSFVAVGKQVRQTGAVSMERL